MLTAKTLSRINALFQLRYYMPQPPPLHGPQPGGGIEGVGPNPPKPPLPPRDPGPPDDGPRPDPPELPLLEELLFNPDPSPSVPNIVVKLNTDY